MQLSVPEAAVNTSVVFMHIFFLRIDPCQHHSMPRPFWGYTKSYFSPFHNYSLRPLPLLKASKAKPTLGVCLLEKIASFIYHPLALFSQWIPGFNVISQETLPMCTPVIPHPCKQNQVQAKGGEGGREAAAPLPTTPPQEPFATTEGSSDVPQPFGKRKSQEMRRKEKS